MKHPPKPAQPKVPKKSDIAERFAGKGVFPQQLAFTLLIPLRNIFLSPKKLIQRLELKPDSSVLEVGPGPGYFSTAVAKHVSRGTLTLADIQQEMLDWAKKRIGKKGLSNVSYHLCDGESFPFADNSFDVIFLITVLGEVENKEAYLKKFHRILKPDGILSISELAGDPDKIPAKELKNLLKGYGFKADKLYGNRWNYTLNFKKRPERPI